MCDVVVGASGLDAQRVQCLLAGATGGAVAVDFDERAGNARIGLRAMEDALRVRLGAHALDLVESAGTVVLGDLAHPRGRNEAWSRRLRFHLPARDPEALEAVVPALSELLAFVLGDEVAICIEASTKRAPRWHRGPAGESLEVDCACLLSGGIDSLAGAVLLLEAGRQPVFVTHRSENPAIAASQRHVQALLNRRYGPQPHLVVPLAPSRRRQAAYPYPPEQQREPSRRSRSLFPLAVAAAACAALGQSEIHVPENGVMAAQLPLTRARVSSFTTRTTHPRWLRGLAEVFSKTLGRRVDLVNPIAGQTKAELVRDVVVPRLGADAIGGTVSCWSAGRGPLQCGGCLPCLLRRFALETAGVRPEAAQLRPLEEPESLRGTDAFTNLAALLSLVRDFHEEPESRLLTRYPEVTALGADRETTIAALRRFAGEVSECVRARYPVAARWLGV